MPETGWDRLSVFFVWDLSPKVWKLVPLNPRSTNIQDYVEIVNTVLK